MQPQTRVFSDDEDDDDDDFLAAATKQVDSSIRGDTGASFKEEDASLLAQEDDAPRAPLLNTSGIRLSSSKKRLTRDTDNQKAANILDPVPDEVMGKQAPDAHQEERVYYDLLLIAAPAIYY